jgi:hypothetical protein
MRLHLATALLLLLCAAVALAAPPQRLPVAVTRDDDALPSGCRPAEAADLVSDFLDAFNSGDRRAALAIADPRAGPRDFRPRGWYSVTEGDPRRGRRGRHFVAYRQGKLGRYLTRRHRRGETMRLLELSVGRSSMRGHAGISYRIERRARDLRAIGITNRVATGKAAVDCTRRKIYVWSMAMAPRRALGGHLCPAAPEGSPRSTLACSRR